MLLFCAFILPFLQRYAPYWVSECCAVLLALHKLMYSYVISYPLKFLYMVAYILFVCLYCLYFCLLVIHCYLYMLKYIFRRLQNWCYYFQLRLNYRNRKHNRKNQVAVVFFWAEEGGCSVNNRCVRVPRIGK